MKDFLDVNNAFSLIHTTGILEMAWVCLFFLFAILQVLKNIVNDVIFSNVHRNA